MALGICRNSEGGKKDNAYFVHWNSDYRTLVEIGVTVGTIAGVDGIQNKWRVIFDSWNGNIATIRLGWAYNSYDAWIDKTINVAFDFGQAIGSSLFDEYHGIVGTILGYGRNR